ncbi:restriction endonuclease subunit S [Piscinibacter sp.]|uniref:restriction endonuclease subunit S n=1 Tax=Piscinibacter sp. TaxID=1903157 RepID=UPI0035B4A3C5
MSAVLEAQEPTARNLDATQPALVRQFELLATAAGGASRLRELILTLAVQGKLVPQDPNDEPAAALLRRIQEEKDRLVAAGKLKRDKVDPTVAMKDAPYALPDSWVWSRLGAVAKKITDGTHHSPANFANGDFKYLSAKNIKSWGIDLTDVTYVPYSVHQEIYSRCDPEYGDILYIKDGATTGVLTVNTLTEQFSLLSSVGVVKPSCGVTSAYLALLMRSPFFYQAMRDGMTGVAITRVTLSKLGAALVPLPPLAEQARIVARVDELMRLCDALEAKGRLEEEQHARLLGTLLGTLTDSSTPEELAANWQRVADHFDLLLDRPEAVDALEQTILQLAVRGLLVPQDRTDEPAGELLKRIREHKTRLINAGEIRAGRLIDEIDESELPFGLPPGWAWARFGDITINRDGERIPVSSSDRERRAKLYDYYGASGVIDKIDGYLFDKTLLLIGEDGANLLNRSTPIAFLAHGKYWVNNHAHVIDTMDPGLMRYLELFVNAISLEPYVTGTAQPKMNQAKLNSIVVALPPLPEQARIFTRVTALRRLCADLRSRLERSRAAQTALADALIDQALPA